jgi:hypothetical protein
MGIRLSLPMTALLREVAKKHGVDPRALLNEDGTWHLTREDRENLIDAISSEFSVTGLKPDGEPNSRGLQLEELLDRINALAR